MKDGRDLVYIYDPGCKKGQIDAGAKEIRVTSVAKSAKESDLEGLLFKVNPSPTGAQFD